MGLTIEQIRKAKTSEVSKGQYSAALVLLELKGVLINEKIKDIKKETFTYDELDDIIENLKF